ncbi:MAG: MutS-related protein [Sphingobacteriales bacterium]
MKRKLVNVGLLRLTAFMLAAISVYYSIKWGENRTFIASLALIALFLYLVRKYQDISETKELTIKLLFINQNEAGILKGKNNLFDNGNKYAGNEKYFLDLDVFGSQSIFHLLNRTTTGIGIEKLASRLKQSFRDKETIESYQQAVQELTSQTLQRQFLTAKGLLYGNNDKDLEQINSWLSEKEQLIHNKWYAVMRWLLPVINIATIFYWFYTVNYLPFIISAVINWAHIGMYTKHTNRQHQLMGKKQELLNQYASILQEFSKFTINNSVLLKQLQNTSSDASAEIKKLSRISNFFDQRLNLLVTIFFNTIFLYDIQCLIQLEKWKTNNKENFFSWLEALSEMEYFNSLACFTYNNPSYSFPVITEVMSSIEAVALSHPLLNADERVSNDFAIGINDKLQLVTGSNMSGKTTFLRSVGVNVLLAQCGAPVCAKRFVFTPVQILSSIRVSDSLQEHTSYFMAELNKLHFIIEELQTGKPSLVLIDEILRGTNSDDKSHGSEQFIRKLLPTNSLTLFATHDLSLGVMEKEFHGKISNYCFESVIQNGELSFDYKLRPGIAQNKNASFLMEKMGII